MSTPTLGPSRPLDLPTPPPLHLSSSYTSVITLFPDSASSSGWKKSPQVQPHRPPAPAAEDEDVPELHEYELADLPYADATLDARKYRQPSFASTLLSLLRTLRVPKWSSPRLSPQHIVLERISGALTNAVFFVSYSPPPTASPISSPVHPSTRPPPTLLLRIYGPSTSSLLSRPNELRTLHVLSTQYALGPRLFGTFANGRVEQFFPSRALTAQEMRGTEVSGWIGKRMRELHGVELARVCPGPEGREVGVWRNVHRWLPYAREVLSLLSRAQPHLPPSHPWSPQSLSPALDLPTFERTLSTYRALLPSTPPLVFAHNDAQAGNLLRLIGPPTTPTMSPLLAPLKAPHHQLIVVDFEYASPNAAALDVANHFHEWCFDYALPTEESCRLHREWYPSKEERRNFIRAYLGVGEGEGEEECEALEREVRMWSPASHAMWALWGLVQAREDVQALERGQESLEEDGEEREGEGAFDYVTYAGERMGWFAREVEGLLEEGGD